jgi:hypothetical protein
MNILMHTHAIWHDDTESNTDVAMDQSLDWLFRRGYSVWTSIGPLNRYGIRGELATEKTSGYPWKHPSCDDETPEDNVN